MSEKQIDEGQSNKMAATYENVRKLLDEAHILRLKALSINKQAAELEEQAHRVMCGTFKIADGD